MSISTAASELIADRLIVDIAADEVVSPTIIARGSGTVLLIVCLFLLGASLVASVVLGSGLLAIGTFVAFSMMMLIGLPLILACVEDAIDPQ